jgi:hypothetical protein
MAGGPTVTTPEFCGEFEGHSVDPTSNEVCIVFENPLNDSVQLGDRIYYSKPVSGQSGVNHPSNPLLTKPIYLGIATYVMYWDEPTKEAWICIEEPVASTVSPECEDDGEPAVDSGLCCDIYYFFSKDNEVNLTSLVGYYSRVQIRNNSLTEAEIFSITADFAESSR